MAMCGAKYVGGGIAWGDMIRSPDSPPWLLLSYGRSAAILPNYPRIGERREGMTASTA